MPFALNPTVQRFSKMLALAGVLLVVSGCSVRKLAINAVADTFAGGASVFAQDEDPELVAQALPFALKTLEALLAEAPDNPGLLLAACSGFTQYSYAFVETEAFFIEPEDFRGARRLRERALKLYLRARNYCLEGLELAYPGVRRQLMLQPEESAQGLGKEHLDLIYWTAASWGAAISLGQQQPDLAADLPVVRSLLERALSLDEAFAGGALHEAMIALASLPEALGGSEEAARRHFARARELSGGRSAGPYVTLARSVSVANQDRGEFKDLLKKALEVDAQADPDRQLVNILAQRQAEELLERIDDYFFVSDEDVSSEDMSSEDTSGEDISGEDTLAEDPR